MNSAEDLNDSQFNGWALNTDSPHLLPCDTGPQFGVTKVNSTQEVEQASQTSNPPLDESINLQSLDTVDLTDVSTEEIPSSILCLSSDNWLDQSFLVGTSEDIPELFEFINADDSNEFTKLVEKSLNQTDNSICDSTDKESANNSLELVNENDDNMDLSLKQQRYASIGVVSDDHVEAVDALMQLSSPSFGQLVCPNGSESESQDSTALEPTTIKTKRFRKTSSSGGEGNALSKSSRASRRSKKKEFLHMKDDPNDPIAQRARYAKTYRERKKQEHEVEVNHLKGIIAERDRMIDKLKVENDKMSEELTKVSLTRQQTIKFSKNIAAVVNSMRPITGIDIKVTPALGDLNSPKLSEKECIAIAQSTLNRERATITFDYSESDKKLVAEVEPSPEPNLT